MAGPLKLGMVGGGQGAFIGAVHRMAARLDGHWTIVAGALARATRRVRFLPLDVVAEDLGAALAVLRTVVAQLSPPSTELRRLALLELVEHTARVFTGTVL